MSQIFSVHEVEKCEFCDEVMAEIGINKYICLNCRNSEDNF